jgi:predicted transcriptional regulator
MERIVLAVRAENADAILDGTRRFDHRTLPPRRLPARAYLAVAGRVVGECELGAPERRTEEGWQLPISKPKRYKRPKAVSDYGIAKTPRSFRYVT